jgi:NADH-quinone oxidoreductase subunit J
MNFEIIFYFIFSSIALISALFVIYSKNTVYSVYFLILVFFSATGLLLISEIEFLSIMLIIIYVGAITVLFLFIVMMLNINNLKSFNNFIYLPIIIILFITFFFEIFLMFSRTFHSYHYYLQKFYIKSNFDLYANYWDYLPTSYINVDNYYQNLIQKIDIITNIETLGQILYTYYTIFILIAGLILIIALIGAVILTSKEKKKNLYLTKNTFQQLSRNFLYAIFQIK